VSVPKENELASLAPQQLKLQLTDGHSFCDGLITDDVDGLTYVCVVAFRMMMPIFYYFDCMEIELCKIHFSCRLNTPSGAKIVLNGVVPLSQNCLQLNSTNCRLLGGAVEKLPNSVVKKVRKVAILTNLTNHKQ
jgi:hypothetical protein